MFLRQVMLGVAGAIALIACSLVNKPSEPTEADGGSTSTLSGPGGSGGGIPQNCGDGVVDPDETCDPGMETAQCDIDCSQASCGDGRINESAGELCDGMGESVDCNDDCTPAVCGDTKVNQTAGETCEDLNTASGDGCSANCQIEGSCMMPVDIPLTGMGAATGSITASTLGGGSQVPASSCNGPSEGAGPDRVYSFTTTEQAVVSVTVTGNGIDTLVRVTSSPCDVNTQIADAVGDGCTNTGGAGSIESLSFPALAAGTYYVLVDTLSDSDVGQFTVDIVATAASSCMDIITGNPNAVDGVYTIDPDGPGGSPTIDVYCDMTTEGGGWTLVYYVDAEHFDGVVANNNTASTVAPTAINLQGDIWNAEQVMTITETLLVCTTQNDAQQYHWRYATANPHTYWSDPTTSYDYQQSVPSVATNATAAGCVASHKNSPYGFMITQTASCGSCTNMLWGMYHYTSSAGCNNTSNTYGNHASPWDNRQITYPICNMQQTSNGKFWMGVR